MHALVRWLAGAPGERVLVAMALVALVRQRRLGLKASPLIAAVPSFGHPKLALWQAIAAATAHNNPPPPSPSQLAEVVAALKATQAYRDAEARLECCASSPFGRSPHYRALLESWRAQPPESLMIFHHYDRRGWLPGSWMEALRAIGRAGWTVVVSSNDLQPQLAQELEQSGIVLALRANVGLCLGAYKDLALLLQQDQGLATGLRSLVLCNDSTLPLAGDDALPQRLQEWVESWECMDRPVMAGLTDSAERGRYHLQSFFLYCNGAWLQHPAWQRFWLRFCPFGSKDDLINTGEIDFSQAALAADVALEPAYPLVAGLLDNEAMAGELQRFGIHQPKHVNQALFAWQSLLERGFPLVKKHVLFDLLENQGQAMAIASLARWIPPDRRSLLSADLQELFVSRYAFATPESG